MTTRIDEIAPDIYRLSTYVPEIAPPAGFTFNQFLIDADEPLLYHTGPRMMFPAVSAAVERLLGSVDRLRWVSFAHVESDESGAMNLWLDAAPRAEIFFNEMGCLVSVNDLAGRPPHVMQDGDVLDIGGKRIRLLETPHVPHNWESQMIFEETTGALFCGDIFTHVGDRGALVEDDVLEPAIETEDVFHANSLSAHCGATLRRLADLAPRSLAIMHGASFSGDGTTLLKGLADEYDRRVVEVLDHGLDGVIGRGCPDPTAHTSGGVQR